LLNALNKEYSVVVKYAVRFAGYPANYVLVNDTPYYVNALIRGRGYDLLWPLYGPSGNLRVNLEGARSAQRFGYLQIQYQRSENTNPAIGG
jgi:hypothetical protein